MSINKLIKEVDLDVMLIREKGHSEVRQAFHLNLDPKWMQTCDTKAKEIRMNTETKDG